MTHFLFVCVCSWGGMWVEVCVCVYVGGGGIYLQLARFSSLSAKVSLLMPPHLLHTHTHTRIHILNYHTLKIIVCVCVCVCVCNCLKSISSMPGCSPCSSSSSSATWKGKGFVSSAECVPLMNCHVLRQDFLIPQTLSDKHVLLNGGWSLYETGVCHLTHTSS